MLLFELLQIAIGSFLKLLKLSVMFVKAIAKLPELEIKIARVLWLQLELLIGAFS